MPAVARIFRHPIKALGVECVDTATLGPGTTLPGDRMWAVAHEAAPAVAGWQNCNNFVRGAKSGALMAITATLDEERGRVALRHSDRPEITLDPDTAAGAAALIDWIRPLCDSERALPSRVVRIVGRGMTDSDFPSISILGESTRRVLEDRAGHPLDRRRFRGNIWLEGTAPWEEFGWIGRKLRIGGAELEVRKRITRCVATHVDPSNGRADTDILRLLQTGWNHRDFGVHAVVTAGGRITTGDAVCLI